MMNYPEVSHLAFGHDFDEVLNLCGALQRRIHLTGDVRLSVTERVANQHVTALFRRPRRSRPWTYSRSVASSAFPSSGGVGIQQF
jgi:hypothetical protein